MQMYSEYRKAYLRLISRSLKAYVKILFSSYFPLKYQQKTSTFQYNKLT